MVGPWHSPTYFKRCWCIYEIFTATTNKSVKVSFIMNEDDRKDLLDSIGENGEKELKLY